MIVFISQLFISPPIVAQDSGTPGWTKLKDHWGQLLFCQRIYTLPEVKTRLYSFDVEQCNEARQLAENLVSGYSKEDQSLLKSQAEQHAYRLSYNTSEPYHSVTACREYCKELVEKMEKSNDK